jgi:hypothetical protein
MRARFVRATVVASVLALMTTFVPAPAGAVTRRAPLTDDFCSAFGEFYTVTVLVEFSVALFEAFSQVPDDAEGSEGSTSADGDDVPDADQLRASYYALLSPKLAAVTNELARTAPRVIKSVFRQQSEIFDRGVELLRDAGIPESQIDAIADGAVDSTTAEVSQLTGEVDISDDAIETLARDFLVELDAFDAIDVSPKAERTLDRASSECGITPSVAYDCHDVLPESEAEAILGDTVTLEDEGCDYKGPEPVDGQTPEIEVLVYDSARAFDVVVGPVETEDVEGIGDQAVALEGFNADGHTITCGRTLVVADGDRTIVTALCLGDDDREVSDEELVEITEDVLERIG